MIYRFVIPMGVEEMTDERKTVAQHDIGHCRLRIEVHAASKDHAVEIMSKAISSLILDEHEGYIVKKDVE